ncbi:hypothetical protein CMQ_7833 [Grosmannia clavigera kw1407]|uniref:Inner kinetochore subunit AME1 domain-containing protein n=1 Tax=Grosmannia clavigera (strain kw1407 / UAMH 11150) TaxID=655863 RepID=F0XS65_GROCL|nr:uncharacterized protein CMQ_7833 [Grosmannia clavigera kw1407]EFW99465.1 hypothetical protein CMQ_7833 [Grosmannia clavigera kw1407]
MATNREERWQQRMRGAQRHQVQEAAFDLFFPEPEPEPASEPTEEEAAVETEPTPAAVRASPNTSAKRRQLDGEDEGPVGVTAAVRVAEEEQVDESPMDAPGSGRRRSVAVGAAADRTAALQEAFSGSPLGRRSGMQLGDEQVMVAASSSPPVVGAGRRPPQLSSGNGGGANETQDEAQDEGQDEGQGDDMDNGQETLSPELASAVDTTRAGGRTSLFSRLARARRSAAATADGSGDGPDALDELSSPSLPGVEPAIMPSSSPLARKSAANVRSGRAGPGPRPGLRRPGRSTLAVAVAADTDRDELSPEQPPPLTVMLTRRTAEVPSSSPPAQEVKRRRGRPPAVAATVEVEEEEAEAIDEVEAARTIGRKRPQRSNVHEPSPELGSDRKAAEPEIVPMAKRRRRPGPQQQSPAVQKQPRAAREKGVEVVEEEVQQEQELQTRPTKTRKARAPAVREQTNQKKRKRRQKEAEEEEEDGEVETEGNSTTKGRSGPPIPITVQRFSRQRRRTRAGKDDGDDDLDDKDSDSDNGDIPYANRSGVNVIDVLAQVCEDIVAQKLEEATAQAAEAKTATAAGDSSAREARRDALARQQALEAFQAELRARLLAQAAAVDAALALRRRVRAAHRQKLALREEILRIRAEREQVALRMDALRAQHQEASRRAMVSADMSTAMHDVDLAVEQGRTAPDLTAAQQKTAELGNLELVVSRVAEQLCGGGGGGGGVLQQIMDFNAFLERTAVMLEGRGT